MQTIARQKDLTAAQGALAWVLRHGDDVVPIPGATRPEHLEENVAAADLTLTDDEARPAWKRSSRRTRLPERVTPRNTSSWPTDKETGEQRNLFNLQLANL